MNSEKTRRVTGRRGLILKRNPFYGQKVLEICPDHSSPPKNVQNLSGSPYTPIFWPKFVRSSGVKPKIATDEAMVLRNARNEGLVTQEHGKMADRVDIPDILYRIAEASPSDIITTT